MTHRTTKQDVDRAARALEDSLKALGAMAEDDALSVRHGSKHYGQAFRLQARNLTNGEGWRAPPYGMSDFLGMTKREAFHTLAAMNRVLWVVRNAQHEANRREVVA